MSSWPGVGAMMSRAIVVRVVERVKFIIHIIGLASSKVGFGIPCPLHLSLSHWGSPRLVGVFHISDPVLRLIVWDSR